ncbi:MBL fold metallo-hydrolase [Actinomyces minihominis]|uniref:MBL fold metallo-hydrolase n=1 Tax=Actinomyces minihominis TaxID=2002838 RepID=UPI000C0785B7|nr:MBL fold metallo-hydrolase [Actinomyces minihominis]
MKLTILGATGSMSGPSSPSSSYLVQADGVDDKTGEKRTYSIVLDMGPGSFGELWNHIDPQEVDGLFISHGHADHLADVISYYVFLKWHPEGSKPALLTAGPPGIFERIMQIDGYATTEEMEGCFAFEPLSAGHVIRVGPMTITAFPGYHSVESYGFRIEGPSSEDSGVVTIAYTGDTDSCEQMTEMAQGVDILLAECGFTEELQTRGIHLTGVRAGELATEANVKHLVLTHIQPWTDPEVARTEARSSYLGTIDIARTGTTWVI